MDTKEVIEVIDDAIDLASCVEVKSLKLPNTKKLENKLRKLKKEVIESLMIKN